MYLSTENKLTINLFFVISCVACYLELLVTLILLIILVLLIQMLTPDYLNTSLKVINLHKKILVNTIIKQSCNTSFWICYIGLYLENTNFF